MNARNRIAFALIVSLGCAFLAIQTGKRPEEPAIISQRALIQQATHLGTMAGNDPSADNLEAIQSALDDLATDPRLKDVLAGAFLLAAYEAIKSKPLAYDSLNQN